MAFTHLTMVKNHSCHTLAWSHSMIVPTSLLWDCVDGTLSASSLTEAHIWLWKKALIANDKTCSSSFLSICDWTSWSCAIHTISIEKEGGHHVQALWNCLMTYFIIPCFHRVSNKTSTCDCFVVSLLTEMKAEMNKWRKINDVHQRHGLVLWQEKLSSFLSIPIVSWSSCFVCKHFFRFLPVNLLTLCHPQTLPREVGIYDGLQSRHAERVKEGRFELWFM